MLVLVLVAKYCDCTPLYRQAQILARHGAEIDRSTLAGWVGGACWWLDALHERLCRNAFASDHLFADDTPVPVLDPGRGRARTGGLWVYARDQRAWGRPGAAGGHPPLCAGPQGCTPGGAPGGLQGHPACRRLCRVREADRRRRRCARSLLGFGACHLAIGAAHQGHGLALGVSTLVTDGTRSDVLVAPFERSLPIPQTYGLT